MLERGQIDFAERALVDYAVNAHAEIFLIVCAEVFERYADTVFLNAVNPRRAHSSREEGVFRKIFEVSAAERAALDVDAGTENGGDAESFGFLCNRRAHFFQQGGVPRACRRYGGGEAGCGIGFAHNVGSRAFLFFTQSVRAVRHAYGRNARAFDGESFPERKSGAQSGFFFE